MRIRKPAAPLIIFLTGLFLNSFPAAGQAPDLNLASTFTGHWRGELNTASLGVVDSIRFRIANAGVPDKVLFIRHPARKGDTTLCDFREGVLDLPPDDRLLKGLQCPGKLQFSLLDADNMTASFQGDAQDCSRISFRGQRWNVDQSPLRSNEAPEASATSETAEAEALAIRNFGNGRVKRVSKSVLRISLGSGKTVSFTDKGGDEDEGQVRYRFEGIDEATQSFVIYQQGWESGGFIFVNQNTGKQANLYNRDYLLSPDKRWLAVWQDDLESGMEGSFIQVLAVSAAGLQNSFTRQTDGINPAKDWAPNSVRWLNHSVLEIEKLRLNADTGETKASGKIWLVYKSGQWQWSSTLPQIK